MDQCRLYLVRSPDVQYIDAISVAVQAVVLLMLYYQLYIVYVYSFMSYFALIFYMQCASVAGLPYLRSPVAVKTTKAEVIAQHSTALHHHE